MKSNNGVTGLMVSDYPFLMWRNNFVFLFQAADDTVDGIDGLMVCCRTCSSIGRETSPVCGIIPINGPLREAEAEEVHQLVVVQFSDPPFTARGHHFTGKAGFVFQHRIDLLSAIGIDRESCALVGLEPV